ncbi:manganese and iron superoxide dismutase [Sporormia fimetaria CBS 119925]|uniref:Superoxide dismutase [Mn], mitochondrial n=1 Tax=Sporormia fimetaria CBS 119925 TaxID=1340428 RepID=A0A6A6VMG7_9PLEO|nr:manganese and iron superoxide dismutase [Sporormia fimetaria CBS 119925]
MLSAYPLKALLCFTLPFSTRIVVATQDPIIIQPIEFGAMSSPTYHLPPLPYGYNALEPHISTQIMELHHSGHHQAYVNNLNAALKNHAAAVQSNDIRTQISLQQAIKFNAGGHINHSLFWRNLAPPGSSESKSSSAPNLIKQINATWGDEEKFRDAFKTALLGIQGSGWGWLVKTGTGADKNRLSIITTKDQDPVVGKGEVPIFGVDMWEHAYYLQYKNGKAAYVENIWNVINWKVAEKRFLGSSEDDNACLKSTQGLLQV